MKGKVTCPKCLFKFIVESDKEGEKEVKCPNCGNVFIVKIGKTKSNDVKWVQYGGARKAILPVPQDITNRPITAGALLAISSVVGFVTVALYYIYPNSKILMPFDLIFGIYAPIYAVLTAVFSVISLIGSYCSLRKMSVEVAIVGSIAGILSFGLLVVSPILSIVALLLLITSKAEFERGFHGKEL